MKKAFSILAVALALLAAAPAEPRAPENDSITQSNLRADLFFLASDALKGRLTDSDENRIASEYIKSRFERAGLKPAAPGNSYFQTYDLMTATLAPTAVNAVDIVSAGVDRQLRLGLDFYPHRYSASATVTAPVAFVGYGISAPHLQHNDYNGDVNGKIVIALEHEPGERDPNSPFDGLVTSESSTVWRKVLAAQDKHAVGVLFVADVNNHPAAPSFDVTARNYWPETPPRIKSYTLATWANRVHIPVAQISPAVATSLLASSGKSLDDLSKLAETAHGFAPLALPDERVTMRVAVDRHTVPDRNVVALAEGADPRLKDEWVIVSAHFDHEGVNGALIMNGADDNGSGTVALLEIADAYARAAKAGQRPKRSVLFAAWNSEERGLLGAWAFTEHPLAPLTSLAAVLNMDMIGRNEEIPVGGGQRFNGLEVQTAESNANALNVMGFTWAPDVALVLEKANAGINLELKKRYDNNPSNLVRRSDQWPFLQRGVPALGFMTGLHPDYHTQYDRPEKINYVKLEKVARLIHQASWELANGTARPKPPVNRTITQ